MGFAKYHEDDMEIWGERNRDRQFPQAKAMPFSYETHTRNQNTSTSFLGAARTFQQKQSVNCTMAKSV